MLPSSITFKHRIIKKQQKKKAVSEKSGLNNFNCLKACNHNPFDFLYNQVLPLKGKENTSTII